MHGSAATTNFPAHLLCCMNSTGRPIVWDYVTYYTPSVPNQKNQVPSAINDTLPILFFHKTPVL